MSWIKRNLVFVVLGSVAVLGLGLSGWYLYAEWSANNESTAKLEQAYTDLTAAATANPNAGNEKVDNIKNAKDYQVQVRAEIAKAKKFFQPIQPIPPGTNISAAEFSGALRRTIDDLTRAAANASVNIQPKYDFSFAVEKPKMQFPSGSLEPLAAQLGDIKAICDVLFSGKVNNLYSIRRVRVCEYDLTATQSDYIEAQAVTNELAVLVPYEVTFYGFSGEVAAVLSGFANRSQGFIITTINVEPGTPSSADAAMPLAGPGPEAPYGGNPYRPYNPYAIPGAAAQVQQPVPTAVPGRPGAPNVALDEKQLKVTMGISVVKLLTKE